MSRDRQTPLPKLHLIEEVAEILGLYTTREVTGRP
jgi:hypothetical protein